MKVFISVDMEGVTGITDPEDVLPDGADYERGRVFMTGDANAIAGAFDGGATEVLVNDAHWTMRNLLLEQLDSRARRLIKGFQKPMCIVQGLDASFPRRGVRRLSLVRGHRARRAQPHAAGVSKPTSRLTSYPAGSPSEAMSVIVTQLLIALQVGRQGLYS